MDAPGTQPVDPYRHVSGEAIASGGTASTMEQKVLDFPGADTYLILLKRQNLWLLWLLKHYVLAGRLIALLV